MCITVILKNITCCSVKKSGDCRRWCCPLRGNRRSKDDIGFALTIRPRSRSSFSCRVFVPPNLRRHQTEWCEHQRQYRRRAQFQWTPSLCMYLLHVHTQKSTKGDSTLAWIRYIDGKFNYNIIKVEQTTTWYEVREKLTRPIDTPTRQSDSCIPAKQQSII